MFNAPRNAIMRRIALLAAGLLFLHVSLTAAVGWLLRQQLEQQMSQTLPSSWLQQRLHAGLFSTGVELVTRPVAPLAAQFHGRLQHGPLLRSPLQPGLLRLRGDVSLRQNALSENVTPASSPHNQNQREDLTIDLRSNLRGDVSTGIRLPQRLNLQHAQPTTSGPLHGLLQVLLRATAVQAELTHPGGQLCLPDSSLSWQALETELTLADYNAFLQQGSFGMRSDTLGWQRASGCTGGTSRADDRASDAMLPAAVGSVHQLHIELHWPQAAAPSLSLQAQRWQSADKLIGPVSLALELHNLDRVALAEWLPTAYLYQFRFKPDPMLQLNFAAQTAALLQQQPRLKIDRLLIDSGTGRFELSGEISLRPGGLRAELQGETSAAAARQILTVMLQDEAAASRMLQQWQRLGIVQELDGRWLINIVVNR